MTRQIVWPLGLGDASPLAVATSHPRESDDVTLTFLIWVLLGATLALAGVIMAYIERRD
jgi:hypothetical protein